RNLDLFHRTKQFEVWWNEFSRASKFQYFNVRLPSKGQHIKLSQIRKNGRNDYLVMASNDYFGLAAHPEVIAAANEANVQYGFGSTGSPVSTGITEIHEELCDHLAKLFKKEKVLLYNSGYTANVGT